MLCVIAPGWDTMSSQPTFGTHGVRRSKTEKILLPRSFAPSQYSVICGRGKAFSAAPGNQWLRKIVSSHISAYAQSNTKIEKSAIVSMIVSIVKKASPDGGAFVCFKEGRWWEEQEAAAREKVGCYLRDAMPTKYRSSTRAKLERRRAVKSDMTSFDVGDTTSSSRRGAYSDQHRVVEPSIPTSPAVNVNSILFDDDRLRNTSSSTGRQTGEFLEQKLSPSHRPQGVDPLQAFQQTSADRTAQGKIKLGVVQQTNNAHIASFPRSRLPDSLRDSHGIFGPEATSSTILNLSTIPDSTTTNNSNMWTSNNNDNNSSSLLSKLGQLPLDHSSMTATSSLEALLKNVDAGFTKHSHRRHDIEEDHETTGADNNIPTIYCDDEMLGNLAYGEIASLDDDAISQIFEF